MLGLGGSYLPAVGRRVLPDQTRPDQTRPDQTRPDHQAIYITASAGNWKPETRLFLQTRLIFHNTKSSAPISLSLHITGVLITAGGSSPFGA